MNLRPASAQSLLARIVSWVESRRTIEVVLGLYLLAFSIRLFVALCGISPEAIYGQGGINAPLEHDAKEFFLGAESLVRGHGYSLPWEDGVGPTSDPVHPLSSSVRLSAKRAPGTSLFLAVGILVFGKRPSAGRLSAIVVSSLSAPLMYFLTLRVGPAVPAILAGLGCALYPSWVFYSTTAISEAFVVPLVLLSLLLTLKAFDSSNWGSAFGTGLAWSAATLVRPITAPMAGVSAAYIAWRGGWKRGFLASAAFLLFLSPWLARNYFVFGRPFLLATEGGVVFLGANNPYVLQPPENHGIWLLPTEIAEYRDKLKGVSDEITWDNLQYEIALEYLRQNPRVIPRLVVYKLARWLTPITDKRGGVRVTVLGSYGVLLLLLIVGLFRGVYHRCAALYLVVTWSLLLASITVVYWGLFARGRVLLELVWLPWVSLTVWDLLHGWHSRSRTQLLT